MLVLVLQSHHDAGEEQADSGGGYLLQQQTRIREGGGQNPLSLLQSLRAVSLSSSTSTYC